MTWTKRISFTAWPVGQGLFTQADIWISTEYFRLVYDCGTFCPSRQITAAAFEAIRGSKIDLLVISHFHWDHISRIPELLKCVGDIREVWIPYLAPEHRLLFALSAAVGGVATDNPGPDIVEISNLVAGGKVWFESRGCLVREVGGKLLGGEEEHKDRKDARSTNQEEDAHDSERPTELRIAPLQRITDAFKSGSPFIASQTLVEASFGRALYETPVELLTWACPIKDEASKMLLKDIEEWLAAIGISTKPSELLSPDGTVIDMRKLLVLIKAISIKANRAQARAIYLKMNSDLNNGSLFLMVHPTQQPILYSSSLIPGLCWYSNMEIIRSSPAVIWTGDAPAQVLDQFIQEAKPRLMDVVHRAHIHQFPHHGSAASISSGWLAELGKRAQRIFPISVISAGKSNSFGHPSPETLWRCPSIVLSEGSPPFEASFAWRQCAEKPKKS